MSIAAGLFLLLPAIYVACDSYPSNIIPVLPNTYRVEGVLVKDIIRNTSTIRLYYQRSDSAVNSAEVTYGLDTLICDDSLYGLAMTPAGLLRFGEDTLQVVDETLLDFKFVGIVADTFSIESVVPDRREKLSFETVSLSWTGADSAEGYIMAAVKKGRAYMEKGYSQYVSSQVTSETFNAQAFTVDNVPTNEIDPGWYYLFIYTYTGIPDSALSSDLLPVPLPGQLGDNIDLDELTGRFGTILAIEFDSMNVVAE
ncbi:MAG: hypothetical protein OEW00_07660 [candidate division Zixibacteria bacterium]|nr:hypothetical protein [candidate division Zixibacteria bacterium]